MSEVTIDVHGPLDRVKDVSSTAETPFERLCEECVRLTYADDVPLLGDQSAPVVAGATACAGTSPTTDVMDRPKIHVLPKTREGDRLPVDQGAFHRCDDGT